MEGTHHHSLSFGPANNRGECACLLNLIEGDSAPDPTSTKGRRIYGPAKVLYTRYADGGITANVREADPPQEKN